jgi:hypothetical protein
MTVKELMAKDFGTSWHSYPKIYNIGHRYVKDLFNEEVLVTEKVDGSQFSFGIFNGELKAKSKGKEIVIDAPDKMFIQAIETVKKLAPKLRDGWTYRGEYLSKPKHNVLAYDRIPAQHIILFDVNTAHEEYLDYRGMVDEAIDLGLEPVPHIFSGMVEDAETILRMIDRVSVLGGQNCEGVVVKNYSRFGMDGKCMMGKYVSEKFKEVHQGEWKKANPSGKDFIGQLGDKYRSEARWEKAVQHLKESGNFHDSPRDIGNLIISVRQDIIEECSAEISSALLKYAWGQIERRTVAGLPEWYKERLLKQQFEQGENVDDSNSEEARGHSEELPGNEQGEDSKCTTEPHQSE